jgi:lipopolysaccharide/colanic/teichoic acid biosynthesis glycosyltransferase
MFLYRVQVRPGLTGLAQVFGQYSTRPKDKLRYDILYITRLSPLLDVKLILASVLVTLQGRWQVPNKQIGRARKAASRSKQAADRR